MRFHFPTATQAFNYFSPSQEPISYEQFSSGINGIMPSRFSSKDLLLFYNYLGSPLDFERISNCFYKQSQENNVFFKKMHQKTPGIMDRLRMKIKTSNKDFLMELQNADIENKGVLPLLEFKNLLGSLKIGLDNTEINYILSVFQVNSQPGFIDYKRFLSALARSSIEKPLIQRTKERLTDLKHKIYDFLISAKEAFRQYNEENNGKMTFEQFKKLINDLYQKTNEPLPTYDILRDLFQFIDLRKDGILDIHEWMQTFRGLEEKTTFYSSPKENDTKSEVRSIKTPGTLQEILKYSPENTILNHSFLRSSTPFLKTPIIKNTSTVKTSFLGSPFQWEDSKQYDDLIELIVRNRKILQELMEKAGNNGTISREKAIEIVKDKLKLPMFLDEPLKRVFRFSQKEEGLVHIRFFMEVLKDHAMSWNSPPKNHKGRKGYNVSDHMSRSLNKLGQRTSYY